MRRARWLRWRSTLDDAALGGIGLSELLLILAIAGMIAGLAIPPYRQMQRKALAAQIAGDFQAIRNAAYNYYGDAQRWPRELDRGRMPPELTAYLPESFAFTRGDYQLDWENWELPRGIPGSPATKTIVGVSVYLADDIVAREILVLLGESVSFSTRSKYTFLIQGL